MLKFIFTLRCVQKIPNNLHADSKSNDLEQQQLWTPECEDTNSSPICCSVFPNVSGRKKKRYMVAMPDTAPYKKKTPPLPPKRCTKLGYSLVAAKLKE